MIEIKQFKRSWGADIWFRLYDYEFGDFPIASAVLARNGYVWAVGTAPAYQGRGYCNAIMQELVRVAKTMGFTHLTLHVHRENVPAIRAYMNAGFRGTQNGAYGDMELYL